jgi:hypothetical protein
MLPLVLRGEVVLTGIENTTTQWWAKAIFISLVILALGQLARHFWELLG